MNTNIRKKVPNLLDEAAKLLSADAQPSTSTSGSQNDFSAASASSNGRRLQETLTRARGMLEESSSSGMFRRLNSASFFKINIYNPACC
jgi:hypothetical protein